MAKKRNQQPPEDNSRPAAAADQTGKKPVKGEPARDPKTVKIKMGDRIVTVKKPPKRKPEGQQKAGQMPLKEYLRSARPELLEQLQAQETAAERLQDQAAREQDAAAAEAKLQKSYERLEKALRNPAIEAIQRQQEQLTRMFHNPVMDYIYQQQEIIDRMTEGVRPIVEMNRAIVEAMRSPAVEAVRNTVSAMQESLATAAGTFSMMQSYFNSESWATARQTLEQIAAAAPALLELAREIEELTPYLEAELKKPEYEGKTLDDLLEGAETDDDGNPAAESLLMKAISAARAARDAAAAKEETPRAAITRAQTVEYPLDKPNQIIWNLLEKDTKGQVTFNMAKSGSRKQILTYYSINFDGLSDIQITKRLLPFDKRVYIAVSALFNAGNNVITLSQIYYAMGYTGRPGTTDLEKINDAITKMTTARIYFDNQQEAESYKYRHFKYDGSLLPLERGTVIVNGQLADAAIKIFREPPLITFAKQRQQITTLDVKLLQSPISKTDANLSIEDYLIERISREKNRRGAHSCRILFKTLYAHAGIPDKPKTNTEKQQKKRAPEKIKKYLTYYQKQEFITRFTTETDGITVYW